MANFDLKNMTIAKRLSLIGLVAVVGMIISGAVHQISASRISAIGEELDIATRQMEHFDTLSAGLNSEFSSMQSYAMSLDGQAKSRWQDYLRDNNAMFEQLANELPNQSLQQSIRDAFSIKQSLDGHFKSLVNQSEQLGESEKEGLRGKLRNAVHEIEGIIKGKSAELTISMLMMRRHEKDFIIRGHEKYLKKMAAEAKHFEQLLARSPIAGKALIRSKLDEYQNSFNAFAKGKLNIVGENAAALQIFDHELRPKFEQVDSELAEFISNKEQHRSDVLSTATMLYWAVFLLMVSLMSLAIFRIGRLIRDPVEEVGHVMEELAGGNIVPITSDAGGDIGEMLKAVAVLQEKMRQTFRLERVIDLTPQAIMLADAKTLNIIYMNQAAFELFRAIEPSLPCRVEEMVGKNIDIFHKNPGKQRGLLAEKNNLPLTARFKACDRDIQFSAIAIDDHSGGWDNVMVSWSDITEKELLAQDFQHGVGHAVGEIIASGEQLTSASRSLSDAAELVTSEAAGMSSSSSEANYNVATVASAAEELSASVSNITTQLHEAVKISDEAVNNASESSQVASHLSEASERIGDVVKLIRDIADQTNLLALNASIEAARAGNAGRGFAVVANEVKTLATETARATESISSQIASIQHESVQVASSIDGIAGVIRRMSDINRNIFDAAEQQNVATMEIARSAQHASEATSQVSEAMQSVTNSADSTGKSAGEVMDTATLLSQRGQELNRQVDEFLTRIR